MSKPVVYISGIPSGPSGTGRLISYLQQQGANVICSAKCNEPPLQLIKQFRLITAFIELVNYYSGKIIFNLKFYFLSASKKNQYVLFHPCFIGLKRTIRFISKSNSRVYLYILDNSFFCIRSYNYLPGTCKPCLECIGGHFEASRKNSCKPYPFRNVDANKYVAELYTLVKAGRVGFLAQSKRQADLVKTHFGIEAKVVGLWAQDWNGVFDQYPVTVRKKPEFDVVYHGLWVEAKGVHWLLDVASRCPDLKFLFPYTRIKPDVKKIPPNCTFQHMTWESGLEEAVSATKITIVPSIWSAAIEGSLIKSLLVARACAVIDIDTAYSDEIPDTILLKLSNDPVKAAGELQQAIDKNWQPEKDSLDAWIKNFVSENINVMEKINNSIAENF